jgi:hypothetical protein
MRYVAFALLALSLVLPELASAQGPGSYARRAGPYGGPLILYANYYAKDTCQKALSGRRAAPPGQAVSANLVPVTIVIGPNPKGCGNSRVVKWTMTVGGPSDYPLIRIFFVDPSGRILKIENISA